MPAVNPGDTILHKAFRNSDGADMLNNLLFSINTLARAGLVIETIIKVTDDGGKLLVLGLCKNQVANWFKIAEACLEEVRNCMMFYTRTIEGCRTKLLRQRGDPSKNRWLKEQGKHTGKGGIVSLFRDCLQIMQDEMNSFKEEIKGFNVREATQKARDRVVKLAEQANALYNEVAPDLGLKQLGADPHHVPPPLPLENQAPAQLALDGVLPAATAAAERAALMELKAGRISQDQYVKTLRDIGATNISGGGAKSAQLQHRLEGATIANRMSKQTVATDDHAAAVKEVKEGRSGADAGVSAAVTAATAAAQSAAEKELNAGKITQEEHATIMQKVGEAEQESNPFAMVVLDPEERIAQGMMINFKKILLEVDGGTSHKTMNNVRIPMCNPNPRLHTAFKKKLPRLTDMVNVCFTYTCPIEKVDIDIDDDSLLALTSDLPAGKRREINYNDTLRIKISCGSPAVQPSGVVDYAGLLGCDSLYDVLGVRNDKDHCATDNEIKKKSKELLRRVHSDKVHHNNLHMTHDEQMWVIAKIIEARDILLDHNRRAGHDEFLRLRNADPEGFYRQCMAKVQKAWDQFKAMHKNDGTTHKRWAWFWFSVGLIIAGATTVATVLTAGTALPLALGVGAAAGFMMTGGVGAASYALTHQQNKFTRLGFIKHLGIYGALGAIAGLGVGTLTSLGPYLAIAAKTGEAAVEGVVTAGILGAAIGSSDILVTPKLRSLKAGGIHMLTTIGIGSIFGAAGGAIGGAAASHVAAKPGGAIAGKIFQLTSGTATMPRGEKEGFRPAEDFKDVDPVDEFSLDERIDGGSDDEEIDDDFGGGGGGAASPVPVPPSVRNLGGKIFGSYSSSQSGSSLC